MTSIDIQFYAALLVTAALAASLLHSHMVNRFLTVAKPVAADLGTLGADLLDARDIDKETKNTITRVIEQPISRLFIPLAVFLLIPMAIVSVFRKQDDPTKKMGRISREKFYRFQTCYMLMNAARSPLLAFIVFLEIIILVLLGASMHHIIIMLFTRQNEHQPLAHA